MRTMPNAHVVNNNDGLSSLWLIARHYQVPFEELKRRNLHIMNRFPNKHPRHGWLELGDKVFLPTSQLGNRTLVAPGQRSPKNEVIDAEPWRAFLFILADEVLPSGKLVRKVLEIPGPSQAQYIQAHPEIFGMKPPNPSSSLSLGEHALGNNNSRFLSASTKPGGAPNIQGRPVYIDIKKAQAAGVKIHSTAEIIADLDRLVRANPQLKARVDKLKSVIGSLEGEVLLEGNVPAAAIKSKGAMMATRGLRVGDHPADWRMGRSHGWNQDWRPDWSRTGHRDRTRRHPYGHGGCDHLRNRRVFRCGLGRGLHRLKLSCTGEPCDWNGGSGVSSA
jgi:hypothetical protein